MKLWIRTEKQRILMDRFRFIANKISWTTRVSGVLLSVLSMHFLVVRPLVQRVDRLQSQLIFVDATLSKVAAERATLMETNELLSEIKSQHDEVAGARATIRQLQKLRDELVDEAEQFPAAMRAVRRMSELPAHVFQAEADRYSRLVPDPPIEHPHQPRMSSTHQQQDDARDSSLKQNIKILNSEIVSTSRELPALADSKFVDSWKIRISGQ